MIVGGGPFDTLWPAHSMWRCSRAFAIASLLLASGGGLQAQPVLSGVVRDSAGVPIAGADVTIAALGRRTQTDDKGAFALREVTAGMRLVSIRRIGYAPFSRLARIGEFETQLPDVVLARVISQLDTVITRETELLWKEAPLLREFEDNRKVGLGKFYTRADLEKARGQHIVSLFETSGFTVVTDATGPARWIAESRGVRSLSGRTAVLEDRMGPVSPANALSRCFPLVFLDFQPLSSGKEVPNINRFRADDLEAVEIYRGAAQTPQRYSLLNSHCGVIVLHSRRPPSRKK